MSGVKALSDKGTSRISLTRNVILAISRAAYTNVIVEG